ncbi:MAG: hypothetical protein M1826_003135 [Phylliscum demangeonii]|nr:MAG: hypothetical protein M1826_003135 [Phylliscum demangeonii]
MSATASSPRPVPATPRVISPTPTPSSDRADGRQDGYFAPVTRSAAARLRRQPVTSPPIDEMDSEWDEGADEGVDEGVEEGADERARTKSRRPTDRRSRLTTRSKTAARTSGRAEMANGKATSNGHLSPSSASKASSWRATSRSPSPLGLIPIHRQWRSFIHRHEIPRKFLHVSIGFVTVYLYGRGVEAGQITPYLAAALVPIASVDYLRHQYPALNQRYIGVCGALMRESEVQGWNGVIWYLLGVWIALSVFPKDVGVMAVLLLSWCDTAASTVGRAYGRYTPRIRRGKSLAGTLAACAVGAATAAAFWGLLAPRVNASLAPLDHLRAGFMFQNRLAWPSFFFASRMPTAAVTGWSALAILSGWTGIVGAASELVDLFGFDDNLTIPVLSGLGLWAFLKVFG